MKLTKAQADALRNIEAFTAWRGGPFHKEYAASTRYRVRPAVLEKLRSLGLIDSAQPFAFAFHRVTITEAGRKALEASE